MFSLRRQWHRFQLARELLEQHEYEEAHHVAWDEAVRWLREMPNVEERVHQRSISKWREAVNAKAEQYPSDA